MQRHQITQQIHQLVNQEEMLRSMQSRWTSQTQKGFTEWQVAWDTARTNSQTIMSQIPQACVSKLQQLQSSISLFSLTHCTCCYDEIKGTQAQDFSCSFSDSLSHTLSITHKHTRITTLITSLHYSCCYDEITAWVWGTAGLEELVRVRKLQHMLCRQTHGTTCPSNAHNDDQYVLNTSQSRRKRESAQWVAFKDSVDDTVICEEVLPCDAMLLCQYCIFLNCLNC